MDRETEEIVITALGAAIVVLAVACVLCLAMVIRMFGA